MLPKFLAFSVVLCFGRRCPKQFFRRWPKKYCCSTKATIFGQKN